MAGADDFDFDDLVLDEDFVRAGRREESADERLARLSRIARQNAASEGWRQGGPAVVVSAERARPPRRGRRLAVAVLSVAALLVGAVYAQERGWLSGDRLLEARPQGTVDEAPGAPGPATLDEVGPDPSAPVPEPTRLLPLPPDPGGEGGYRFVAFRDDAETVPVTYDPCRPVRYAHRRAGEVPGGEAMVDDAFARISAATGLQFERVADTDEPLVNRRKARQPKRYGEGFAPVLVAWSDERESPDLAGYIAGFAGSTWNGFDDDSLRFVTGEVRLDAEQLGAMLPSPGGEAQVRSTILHELGHLVGLDHVADQDQIMYSEGGDNRLDLGPGDLRGLRQLGAGPCFADWAQLEAAAR
jgi:hypothetical protein